MDAPPFYEFGRFRIDLAARHLLRDGDIVPLTTKAFDTLLLLVRHHDRVVTKDELMQAVWPDTFVSDDSLTQAVSSLRRALGDPELIATIPRKGYRFITPAAPPVADTSRALAPPPSSPPAAVVEAPPISPAPLPARPPWPWLAAAVIASLAAGIAVDRLVSRPAATPPPLQFTQEPPAGTHIVSGGALSPDGSAIAFVAEDARTGTSRIWVRSLTAAEARPVEGTDQAARPFWSPDGRSLGFVANGRLHTMPIDGGPARNLAPVRSYALGASWAGDTILFASWRSGLATVPAAGGALSEATTLDPNATEIAHLWPSFLPDGRHFLFTVAAAKAEFAGVYIGTIGSRDRVRLLDGAHQAAIFVEPGFLVSIRDSDLVAQPFDRRRLMLTGSPVTLVSGVTAPSTQNAATLSAAGALLTFGGGPAPRRLVWFNRAGERLGAIDTPTVLHHPAFCADEKEVMAASNEGDRQGVWVVDLERGVPNRLVPDASVPTPSPDGTQLAYSANRGGPALDIYLRRRNAKGSDEVALVRSPEPKYVNDWTRDGKYLVFQSSNAKTGEDLWVVPAAGGTPVPYLRTEFNEIQSRVSPDGHWLAYTSDESGTWEVYVQAFPTPGAKQVISLHGGGEPVWRRDGKELFYLASDHTLMVVTVSESADALRVSSPRALFRLPVSGTLNRYRSHFAATGDGERFLVDAIDAETKQEPISVIANWTAMFKH